MRARWVHNVRCHAPRDRVKENFGGDALHHLFVQPAYLYRRKVDLYPNLDAAAKEDRQLLVSQLMPKEATW